MRFAQALCCILATLTPACPAISQVVSATLPSGADVDVRITAGRTAKTGIGEVGQRQTRAEARPGAEPMDRIETRISSRIENRIRTRIDRDYDEGFHTTSAIADADARARATGQPRTRRGATPR